MVESTQRAIRKESNVSGASDLDLTDLEHCILCFNDIRYFAMGKCGHKNICHKCCIRIRLIMNDNKCSICKTDLDEIVISRDQALTWEQFEETGKSEPRTVKDREDPSIYYEDGKAKGAGMQLRTLSCLIHNCSSSQAFPNEESLRRHLETTHQKTFCKICLKGRTVFIREQRIYHLKTLRSHIEHGDPANERGAEILPHPWCDFCEEFYYNDHEFYDHLSRHHLTCHLCGDYHKNVYYDEYESLERHFAQTHFLCPYEQCKSKCYVAFQTENEMKAHMNIVHRNKGTDAVNANALLGFSSGGGAREEEEEGGFAGKDRYKSKAIKLQDKEGVDFGYYFSTKYTMKHSASSQNKKPGTALRPDKKAAGGKGCYKCGETGHIAKACPNPDGGDQGTDSRGGQQRSRIVGDQTNSLRGQQENEKKLAMIYQFLHRYLREEFEAGKYEDQSYTFHKAQLYQMYYAMAQLDADKFANLGFTLNFGITPAVKNIFVDWLINGGNYEESRDVVFKATDTLQLLKLHKYFNWADKKLHSVFFIENKDQISDDLLSDFKDGTEMEVKPGLAINGTKKANMNAAQSLSEGMKQRDLFTFARGTVQADVVDVRSERDFPALGGFAASQQKQNAKPQATKAPASTWGVEMFNKHQKFEEQKKKFNEPPKKVNLKVEERSFPSLPGGPPQSQANKRKPVLEEEQEESKEGFGFHEQHKPQTAGDDGAAVRQGGGKKGGRKRKGGQGEKVGEVVSIRGGFF